VQHVRADIWGDEGPYHEAGGEARFRRGGDGKLSMPQLPTEEGEPQGPGGRSDQGRGAQDGERQGGGSGHDRERGIGKQEGRGGGGTATTSFF